MFCKLRHPIRAIREPFGTAGLIIACIALSAALGGTALAAKDALTSGEKKLIQKEAKKWSKMFAKTGPAGPQGSPGASGKNGLNGVDGENGESGAAGAAGPRGQDGSSVSVVETATGCPQGGMTVEVEGSGEEHEICNGEDGENGEKGEKGEKGNPWTAGGTLPQGATETGAWSFSGAEVKPTNLGTFELSFVNTAISFPVPLAAPIEAAKVQANPVGFPLAGSTAAEKEHCPGNVTNPKAQSGYLCIYQSELANVFIPAIEAKVLDGGTAGAAGASTAGALLQVVAGPEGESAVKGVGSWAVTG